MHEEKASIISLDAKLKGSDIDFVSHAHSDHIAAVKSSESMLCSTQTAELISAAYGLTPKLLGSRPEGIRLYDSGHMLGSKQLYIENYAEGNSLIYSGDFQMMESVTAAPINIRNADCLIIDSTYPDPRIRFDAREEVETALSRWVARALKSGIVLFKAYAMGKAQELIKILNDAGITPVVNKKISAINKIYVNNGIGLDYASAYDEGSDYESILNGNFVGIVDSRNFGNLVEAVGYAHKKRVYTSIATGFAKSFRFNVDAQFCLSDHADFKQSIEYIDAVSPKKIYTYGSNRGIFAKNLSKIGYDAVPYESRYAELAQYKA
ncbi:MAG: hypothetical protein QW814_03865 [Methanothrix sp.]